MTALKDFYDREMMRHEGLKAFQKIVEMGSLNKAAQAMGLSQPRLSYAIRALEEELSATLFERTSRGVKLSRSGEIFARRADRFLSLWEQLKGELTETYEHERQSLILGAHPEVAAYSFPFFVPRLLSDFPNINLRLSHGLSREINQKVVEQEIDVGIVVNPVPHADLVIVEVGEDYFTLWQTPTNGNSHVLIFDPALAQSQWLLRHTQALGFTRFIESSHLAVISALTKASAGVGLLPGRIAGELVPFSKTAPVFADKICLVFRPSFRQKPYASRLIEIVKDVFKSSEKSDNLA